MLKLENIDVYYGQSQALKDINIEINQGEFITIIGANGAGKSTIMKTIMGLLEPEKGKIWFEDIDITNKNAWDRASLGIGYIPEGRRIFRDLTVEENLKMGGYILTDKHKLLENIEKSYEMFPRLGERKNQLAKTMSGGEQQMLAIARALMSDPKLLLIDEISMGLMPILVNRSLEILRDLNKNGMTILLVEQNANKALKNANRGYVLETGKIVLSDSSDKLQNNELIIKAYLGG
jgi:branched-chain amino acid transport system ATP-binding protein